MIFERSCGCALRAAHPFTTYLRHRKLPTQAIPPVGELQPTSRSSLKATWIWTTFRFRRANRCSYGRSNRSPQGLSAWADWPSWGFARTVLLNGRSNPHVPALHQELLQLIRQIVKFPPHAVFNGIFDFINHSFQTTNSPEIAEGILKHPLVGPLFRWHLIENCHEVGRENLQIGHWVSVRSIQPKTLAE